MCKYDDEIQAGRSPAPPSMREHGEPAGTSYYWDARRAVIASGVVASVDVHEAAIRKAWRSMQQAAASVAGVTRGR